MGSKVGIDANILICMLSNDRNIKNKVLDILYEQGNDSELCISNIVLAEFYCHNTHTEYEKITSFLNEYQIEVIDFNTKSAYKNGDLHTLLNINPNMDNPITKTKQGLKADTLIIANYLAYNCDIILTCDTGMINRFKDLGEVEFVNPDDIDTYSKPVTPSQIDIKWD